MTRREAAAFAAVVDAVVAPEPPLPPVGRTDATEAFAEMLRRSPRLNAAALRAALLVLDAAPRTAGRDRLRRLSRTERLAFLQRVEQLGPLRSLIEALRTAAAVSYYGDAGVREALRR